MEGSLFKKSASRNKNLRKKPSQTTIPDPHTTPINDPNATEEPEFNKIAERKKSILSKTSRENTTAPTKRKSLLSFDDEENEVEGQLLIPSIVSITEGIKKDKKKDKKSRQQRIQTFDLKRDSGNSSIPSNISNNHSSRHDSEYMGSSKGMYTQEKLAELRKGMIIYQNTNTHASNVTQIDLEGEGEGVLSDALGTVSITDDLDITQLRIDGRDIMVPTSFEDIEGGGDDLQIINAQKIRMAKEKRKKIKRFGSDFIPLDEDTGETETDRKEMQEEEDGESEDQDDYKGNRIKVDTSALVATVNQRKAQKMEEKRIRREIRGGLRNVGRSGEKDEEIGDWELELIKKGAYSKAGLLEKEKNKNKGQGNLDKTRQVLKMALEEQPEELEFEELMSQVGDKITISRKMHDFHVSKKRDIQTELEKSDFQEGETRLKEAQAKFMFFQELQEFLESYAFMMDEKHPVIQQLGKEIGEIYLRRFQKQRRYRKDQLMIVLQQANQANENKEIHFQPTDLPNESDQDLREFKEAQSELNTRARALFEDVDDSFASVAQILSQLESWKSKYRSQYEDTYASLSLADLLQPYLEYELLFFGSFLDASPIAQMPFFAPLLGFIKNTNLQNAPDEDDLLLAKLVDRIILPKMQFLLAEGYNPESVTQSTQAIDALSELSEFFQPSETSPLLPLHQTILGALEKGISQVMIPHYPSESNSRSFGLQMLQRALDTLNNCAKWHPLFAPTEKSALEKLVVQKLLCQKLRPYLLKEKDILVLTSSVERIIQLVPSGWFKNSSQTNFSEGLFLPALSSSPSQELVQKMAKYCFHFNDGQQANQIFKIFS